jgi:hypothetical protein
LYVVVHDHLAARHDHLADIATQVVGGGHRYFDFATSASFGFAVTGGAVSGHPVSSTNVAVSAADGPRWSSSNIFSTRAVCSSS